MFDLLDEYKNEKNLSASSPFTIKSILWPLLMIGFMIGSYLFCKGRWDFNGYTEVYWSTDWSDGSKFTSVV